MIRIVVPHFFRDLRDAKILLLFQQFFGMLQSHADQVMNRRFSYFRLKYLGNIIRTQIHIFRNLIQLNLLRIMFIEIICDLSSVFFSGRLEFTSFHSWNRFYFFAHDMQQKLC